MVSVSVANDAKKISFANLLCLSKKEPKATPGGKLLLLREVELHLLAGVPDGEGGDSDADTDDDGGDADADDVDD